MRTPATAALLAALVGSVPPATAQQAQPSMHVTLETAEGAVYLRHDFVLKLIFKNRSEATVTFDDAAFGREAFTIRDAKGMAPKKAIPAAGSGEKLVVNGYDTAERLINLSSWYPNLTGKKQRWEVSWSWDAWNAGPLPVAVIKAYDGRQDRIALVETGLGTMTWGLMPEHAPQHVKHFVDLARQGFYEGLTIYRVIPGLQAEAGDPKGDGTGGWEHLLMPEISTTVQMGTGLVGAARQETSMTSDSIFFITLSPSEFMLGRHTFFARLTDGWEVIARLHPLPSRGETGLRDSYLLLDPVTIRRIRIK